MKQSRTLCLGLLLLCALLAAAALTFAAGAAENVVYISDYGDNANSGLSADAPVQTMNQAFKKLGAAGGTVVICDTVTVTEAVATFPERDSLITFTSLHGGVNYKAKAASLILQSDVFLGGPTKFENLRISSSNGVDIFCRGNDLTLGFGIENIYSSNPVAIWGGTNCALSGTTAISARYFGYTIEIDSGTWWYVRGGSIRTGEGQAVGTVGDVTIIINGGTITSTTTDPAKNGIIAVAGFDALDGDANIIINGGTINCSVMGLGRPGTNATSSGNAYCEGNVNITINGGNFRAGTTVGAVHDTVASYVGGDFTLTVTGGNFADGFKGFNAECVRGNATYDIADSIDLPTVGFDKVVYVSDAGSDTNDGQSAKTALKTLTAAAKAVGEDGGVIVVCGNLTVASETLPAHEKSLRITGQHVGQSYNSVLTVTGKVTFGGETRIENLTLAGNGRLSGGGHDLTVDEGVKGGSLSLDGGSGSVSHGVTVKSGSFANVSGGSVSHGDAATYVILEGGSVGTVYGGGAGTVGSSTVSVRGGSVTSGVYATEAGTAGDGGIELRGGSVAGIVAAAKSGKIAGSYAALNKGATVTAQMRTDGYASEFVPEATVYVKDGSSGAGYSPETAVGDLVDAVKKLPGGGTIVVCGTLTLESGKTLRALPDKLTITSNYGGVDYRLTDGACIKLYKSISLASETELRDLTVIAAANGTYISAEGNALTIGKGVECRLYPDSRVEDYPALVGGSFSISPALQKSVTLNVYSGTWGSVTAGQYSTDAASAASRTATGDLVLNVYGGRFTDDCFVAGRNLLNGNATLNAYGGEFACSVFGIAAGSTVTGNVTVNAAGASFEGDLLAGQDNTAVLNGSYTLNVTTANLDRVGTVKGTETLGGTHTSKLVTPEGLDLDAEMTGTVSYQNPIAGFADPSVVYADGWYYYTYANSYAGKPGLYMAKAANLCDIGKVEPVLIWSQALTGQAADMEALWAPQLYKLNGKWYIYAACQFPSKFGSNADLKNRLPYVWIADTDDPIGSYTFFGCMENVDTEAYSYLSPRLIEHDGNLYMFCSGFFRAEDGQNGTHIQRMRVCRLDSPTKMATKQIVISTPEYSWEAGIMEGPFPFYGKDGTLYLIFAGGHTRTDEYCTGIMRFNGSATDSLTEVSLWEKFATPLQFTDYSTGVYSPGAMIVTTSPDGKTLYGVYHAKEYHYSAYTMRRMYMQEITFDEKGFPTMTAAQPTSTVYTMALNPLPLAERIVGFDVRETSVVSRFEASRTYQNQFTDVTEKHWFYPYVKAAYEYTLANGTSTTKFSPDGKFTVAQALTAAVNIHKAYYNKTVRTAAAGEAWYAPYVEYCIANGIIKNGQFTNLNADISRGDMAVVFANILPDSEYKAIRDGSNPDVTDSMPCAAAVRKLYRAGIVGGDAGSGNYRPNDAIARSEACVIFTRIAAAEYRQK